MRRSPYIPSSVSVRDLALYILGPILMTAWLVCGKENAIASLVCAGCLFAYCVSGYIFSSHKLKYLVAGQLYLSTAASLGGLLNWETFYPFHLLFCLLVILYNLARGRAHLRYPLRNPLFYVLLLNAYLLLNLVVSAILFRYSFKNLLVWANPLASVSLSVVAFLTYGGPPGERRDTLATLVTFPVAVLVASSISYFYFVNSELPRLNFAAYGLSTTNYILHLATLAWVACYCLTKTWVGVLGFLLAAQALAQSRGAILVLFLALIWIVLSEPLRLLLKKRLRILQILRHGLVVVAVASLGVLVFLPGDDFAFFRGTETFAARWESVLNPAREDANTLGRVEAWQYHIRAYLDDGNPIFGAGVGRIPYESDVVQPHNFFVLCLYQGGAIGLGLFCAVLVVSWVQLPSLRLFVLCFALASAVEILTQTVPVDTLLNSVLFIAFCAGPVRERIAKQAAFPEPISIAGAT